MQPIARQRRGMGVRLAPPHFHDEEIANPSRRHDINGFAEMFFNHRRAFNMPARGHAPRRCPSLAARRLTASNTKSPGFSLGRYFNARTGQHIFLRAPRQAAIFNVLRYVKQHMAFCLISVIAGNQTANHSLHLTYMAGGEGLNIGRQNAIWATSSRYFL